MKNTYIQQPHEIYVSFPICWYAENQQWGEMWNIIPFFKLYYGAFYNQVWNLVFGRTRTGYIYELTEADMVSSLGGSHVLSQYIKVRPLATPRHSPVFHRSISSLHSVGLEKLRSTPLCYGQNLDRNENIIFNQKNLIGPWICPAGPSPNDIFLFTSPCFLQESIIGLCALLSVERRLLNRRTDRTQIAP